MKFRYLLVFILAFSFTKSNAQVLETKNWCLSRCDIAGDERRNTELLHLKMKNDSIQNLRPNNEIHKIPIRIGIVQNDTFQVNIKELVIRKAIDELNESFAETNLIFYLKRTDVIYSQLKLEDLSKDLYKPYNEFSSEYDLPDLLSIYIFDHKGEFCTTEGEYLSCGRTGGFSYILSNLTSNLVMSTFDITDKKIVAHEMGHFFGLYHTFEETLFGKDDFDYEKCHLIGDRICDTPPDPGAFFEVYVNYYQCEYKDFTHENGSVYKPLIQNYMSYYKPCYLKEFSFTPGQIRVIKTAATLPMRSKYIEEKSK